ncbi:hypothetical protein B0H14DRAFT_3595897 [Mycena olivaceomarginata]|nr:hypothetical protein B0H14DRAFT_3595897 [Mycena olivaceomarginata]
MLEIFWAPVLPRGSESGKKPLESCEKIAIVHCHYARALIWIDGLRRQFTKGITKRTTYEDDCKDAQLAGTSLPTFDGDTLDGLVTTRPPHYYCVHDDNAVTVLSTVTPREAKANAALYARVSVLTCKPLCLQTTELLAQPAHLALQLIASSAEVCVVGAFHGDEHRLALTMKGNLLHQCVGTVQTLSNWVMLQRLFASLPLQL